MIVFSYRVPPNYRSVVYCTAMKMDVTNTTFTLLWKEYLKSNVVSDKLVILSSLACSQDRQILEKWVAIQKQQVFLVYYVDARFCKCFWHSVIQLIKFICVCVCLNHKVVTGRDQRGSYTLSGQREGILERLRCEFSWRWGRHKYNSKSLRSHAASKVRNPIFNNTDEKSKRATFLCICVHNVKFCFSTATTITRKSRQ